MMIAIHQSFSLNGPIPRKSKIVSIQDIVRGMLLSFLQISSLIPMKPIKKGHLAVMQISGVRMRRKPGIELAANLQLAL
jgi:hypothetical protein